MGISKYKKGITFKKYNGKCSYCGIKLNTKIITKYNGIAEYNPDTFSIDHIIPNKKNNIENLNPSCRMCNTIKKNKSLEEFRRLRIYRFLKIKRFTDSQVNFLRNKGIDIIKILSKTVPKNIYYFYFEQVNMEEET